MTHNPEEEIATTELLVVFIHGGKKVGARKIAMDDSMPLDGWPVWVVVTGAELLSELMTHLEAQEEHHHE